jgi:hypothetical protein
MFHIWEIWNIFLQKSASLFIPAFLQNRKVLVMCNVFLSSADVPYLGDMEHLFAKECLTLYTSFSSKTGKCCDV